MFPAWAIFLFGIFMLGLVVIIGVVVGCEIRARLIPETEIQKMAEDLIAQHGVAGAKVVALHIWTEAMNRNDLFEAAKWDRVVSWMNKAKAKQ